MQEIWNRLYNEAKRALNPRKVSDMVEAGGVAAAIEAGSGKIYVGVCVELLARWEFVPSETRFSI